MNTIYGEAVTETVYPVSYDLMCWTPLPDVKEAP